ncbi:MAG TPA: class II aldolase/adducin family protein [Casimicrobiaceae bacterium]|nr:class II aldolase/adducin family protein [Casimicrobiaceae bacterium]
MTASPAPQHRYDPAEWAVRVDLAACYRLAAHFGMTDLIYTHISARVPGAHAHFLINAYGLLFDEIRASTLVKVRLEGDVIDDPTGLGINPAGFVIHGAVHGARPDVGCVMHTHTTAGLAVAAQRHGLLPLTQHAMRFTGALAYHDYEGIALEPDEQARLVADLGTRNAMILRNHGLLVCGPTVHDAFDLMAHLERACQAQVAALAGNADIVTPPPAVAAKVAAQFARPGRQAPANAWGALLRMLDKRDPSYRQ